MSESRLISIGHSSRWFGGPLTIGFTVFVLYPEYTMQLLNIILYRFYELILILLNSASDLRSDEKSVESREDSEHLRGITCCSKSVSKASNDLILDSSNTLVAIEGHSVNHMARSEQ